MRWSLAILALSLAGCSDLVQAYNQEYVLYDASKTPPQPGSPAADFAKLLETESLLAEVAQLIADGHDTDGALARGRATLEASTATQRAALGDQLPIMRAARVQELRRRIDR